MRTYLKLLKLTTSIIQHIHTLTDTDLNKWKKPKLSLIDLKSGIQMLLESLKVKVKETQSKEPANNHQTCMPANLPISQAVKQPTNRPTDRLTNRPNELASQPACQPVSKELKYQIKSSAESTSQQHPK